MPGRREALSIEYIVRVLQNHQTFQTSRKRRSKGLKKRKSRRKSIRQKEKKENQRRLAEFNTSTTHAHRMQCIDVKVPVVDEVRKEDWGPCPLVALPFAPSGDALVTSSDARSP